LFVAKKFIGNTEDPGPSIKVLPLGQEGQSRMHTSATTLELIDLIDVSNAVSRIASVGFDVVDFNVFDFSACAGIVVIASVLAIIAIVISFFIKLILLNSAMVVNRL